MSESRNEDTRQREPDEAGIEPEEGTPETGAAGQSAEGDPKQSEPAPDTPAEQAGDDSPARDGDDAAAATDTPSPPPPRGGRLLASFALLLALAAGAAAGYLGWRLYQLEQRVGAIPDERAAALESYLQPDALRPLRSRIESLEAGRDDLARDVEERVDRLQESVESVRAMTERHQIGWRLAEIRYLLSIAVRRLLIAHDPEGAEAALAAADASVAELRDARLLPLRQAIVEDLGAVRAVQPADIEGIVLRLQSLLAQVDSLPRAPLREAGPADEESTAEGWWQQLRREFRDFVVIQRRPAGPAPIEPRAGDGLRPADALRLALEDARRTALARNEADFDTALERAAELLERHFDPQSGATARFSEGLADVRGRSVDTDLPDLSDTLELAQRLAREIEHARKSAAAEEEAPDEER